jgi:hypothetical protein
MIATSRKKKSRGVRDVWRGSPMRKHADLLRALRQLNQLEAMDVIQGYESEVARFQAENRHIEIR